MAQLLTLRVLHSPDDGEYGYLMEGLDQQEASVYVLSATAADVDPDEVEDGVTAVTIVKLRVQADEDYQYDNVLEEIDQSEASAHVIGEEDVPDED